jgi:hypothetical protein
MASFYVKELLVGGLFTPMVLSGMILAGFDIFINEKLYLIELLKRIQIK